MTDNLTPQFDIPIASQEIALPTLPQDSGGTVGGFMSSPNGLSQGQVSLNSAGETILVGSATAPLTGTGVFIGNAGDGTYDFRAGNPAGAYIHWDASLATLTIVGTITATAGTIGGFSIGADYIRDNANSMGIASTVTGGDDVRFWAGDTFANRATAPFNVTESGVGTFTNANLTGVVTVSNKALLAQFVYGQNITAGQPLCALPYSSTIIGFDTNLYNTSSSTTVTQAFTVGNNTNRILLVCIQTSTPTGTTNSMTYNGVSLTKKEEITGGTYGKTAIWYLVNPDIGNNNLVINNSGAIRTNYVIYSYYNVAQNAPEVSTSSLFSTDITVSLYSLTNGGLVIGVTNYNSNLGLGASGSVFTNNLISQNSGIRTGDSGNSYPPVVQSLAFTGVFSSGYTIECVLVGIAPILTSLTTRVYKASSAISITATTYIGIASITGTAGNVYGVVIVGADSNQSGLTIGTNYYLGDTAGTFSASPGTVTKKAGIAIGTGTMIITNIW